jgi:hypothetical protein
MPKRSLAVTVFAAAVLASAAASADPLGQPPRPLSVPQAPVGHLQPRTQPLAPNNGAEQVEQDRMTDFDAQQHKLDVELDKSLNICRC